MISCKGILALLEEPDTAIKIHALKTLDNIVHLQWHEIASHIEQIEVLFEDGSFPQQQLAALVASKVFFHLEEMDDSLKFALHAGELFDVSVGSEYIDMLVTKAIREYILQRKQDASIDTDLEKVVIRMFNQCLRVGAFEQAIGFGIEAKRLDLIEQAVRQSPDPAKLLLFTLKVAYDFVDSKDYRTELLRLLISLFRILDEIDYFAICQSLLSLNKPHDVALILSSLIEDPYKAPIAYQVCFDLLENQHMNFFQDIIFALDPEKKYSGKLPPSDAEDSMDTRLSRLISILYGNVHSAIHLQFLFSQNHSDLLLLTNIKDNLDKKALNHNSLVCSHAFAQFGTTNDVFLRENLEWFAKAKNWAKFTASASLGLIHCGHRDASLSILNDYLPKPGGDGSPYQEGGALYALGLIHHNLCGEKTDYLRDALRDAGTNEIIQSGACLGIGLTSFATKKPEIFNELKNVLYNDNAIGGEAASIAMGLLMFGTGDGECISEMISYAQDTQHEKIIRGLAIAVALMSYGQEDLSDGLVETLLRDKDPILRYGGVYTIGLAYCCTSSNNAVRKLLHLAVTDVNDDVRRAAVTVLGLVMASEPERLPSMVKLLVASYNPFVRYGAAMALGICCAATADTNALDLLEPLRIDRVDFVRQAAFIATAMVVIQYSDVQEKRVGAFRDQIKTLIEDQFRDQITKMGAILATGIMNSGGRNVTISLRTSSGHPRMAAIAGMTVFLQFWYWFPLLHFLGLSFSPTAVIGVTEALQIPRDFSFICNSSRKLFAYPKPVVIKKKEKTKKTSVATLSVTAKAQAKSKQRKAEKNADMDIEGPDATVEKPVENVENNEPIQVEEIEEESHVLISPVRVTPAQLSCLSLDSEQRFVPVTKKLRGIAVLRDSQNEKPLEIIAPKKLQTMGVEEVEEALMPIPFRYIPN